jgi:hypothetical protein
VDDTNAFRRVTSEFYRSKDGELAGQALEQLLEMLAGAGWPEDPRQGNFVYLFARIAATCESARSEFEALLARTTEPQRARLVHCVLVAAGESSFPKVLELTIDSPEALDLLWAEFFVTGSPEPILRIIRTLDLEDAVRRHLNAWLQAKSFWQFGRRARAATLASAGLVVDLAKGEIVTDGDLDCLCVAIAKSGFRIFEQLPFKLPDDDLRKLCVKGAALWSLGINARVHETVAELLRTERELPGGPARRLLQEAAADEPPFAL